MSAISYFIRLERMPIRRTCQLLMGYDDSFRITNTTEDETWLWKKNADFESDWGNKQNRILGHTDISKLHNNKCSNKKARSLTEQEIFRGVRFWMNEIECNVTLYHLKKNEDGKIPNDKKTLQMLLKGKRKFPLTDILKSFIVKIRPKKSRIER